MPGVSISTATRSGPSAPVLAPSGQAFFAGLAAKGSTTEAVLLSGIADFVTEFGDRTSYSHLYDTVKTFFEEGGARAYVARVVGAAATKGFVSLNDRASTPVPTLKFEAANAGAWSTGLRVIVANGSVTDTVSVTITYNEETVESHQNLATPAAVIAAFNGSRWVKVTDLGSTSTAPDNNPAAGTFTPSAGSDDRGAVTATNYTSALAHFTYNFGPGSVSIPGVGTSVHSAIIDHCKAMNRIGILSMDSNTTVSALKAQAANLNSEYAGLFAPWVTIADSAGGSRPIPPDGYVAGIRNRAHGEVGPWRAPAGQIGVARSLTGLVVDYDRKTGDELDAAKVNAIRAIVGTVRLYGWRSLSNDTANYSMLSFRDLLNSIVYESEQRLEQYVFEPIDGKGHLLSKIGSTLTGIVEPIRQRGGLFERFDDAGNQLDPGYLVETGMTVNSLENLANNEVKARVSVRMSPTAALISVTIVKVGLLSGL